MSDNLWDQLTPEIKTDHGGLNLADIAVIVLDLILLLYTGYRSWHFLDQTFSDAGYSTEFAILAVIGLVGLDAGAVIWSLVWMFGSTTRGQDVTAIVMFIVDAVGMVLTSMTDSVGGSGQDVPLLLKSAALYGVPGIILLNVIVGIVYHMLSPMTSIARQTRRLKADLAQREQLAQLTQQGNAMRLRHAQAEQSQQQALLEQQSALTKLKLKLDSLRLGIERALSDKEAVHDKSQEVSEKLKREAGLDKVEILPACDFPGCTDGATDRFGTMLYCIKHRRLAEEAFSRIISETSTNGHEKTEAPKA